MLDKTQIIIKNKLGLTDMQIEMFKAIYDFVSRFSGVLQASWNQDIALHKIEELRIEPRKSNTLVPVPPKTLEIIKSVGTTELYKYFSPHVYPKMFESFCRKLMRGRVIFGDYVAVGLIAFDDTPAYVVEEVEYQDGGVFGMVEVS